MKPFHKILVPLDFSEHSQRALDVASDLSRRYEAPLGIVYSYEPVTYALPEGYVLFSPTQLSRMFAEFEQRLAAAKASASAAGALGVETYLRQGFAASEITALAREGNFDLIVMGTHGRTGLPHVVLGSVAERVVRTAPCPVLTVQAPRAG